MKLESLPVDNDPEFIKLVGLVSVARFAWLYLIREHDRQELIEIIDRTKVEVLGER